VCGICGSELSFQLNLEKLACAKADGTK